MAGDDAYALRAVLRDAGLRPKPAEIAALVRRKRRRYRDLMGPRLRLDAGGARLLRAVAAKVPVAIVSAAAGAEIRACLRASGLSGRIRTIVSAESVRRTKPHPAPYLEALARLGLRTQGTGRTRGAQGPIVTFEDSFGGIASAIGAGIVPIGVTTSYNAARLKRAGARAAVPNLGAVDVGALLTGRWASLHRSDRAARKTFG